MTRCLSAGVWSLLVEVSDTPILTSCVCPQGWEVPADLEGDAVLFGLTTVGLVSFGLVTSGLGPFGLLYHLVY